WSAPTRSRSRSARSSSSPPAGRCTATPRAPPATARTPCGSPRSPAPARSPGPARWTRSARPSSACSAARPATRWCSPPAGDQSLDRVPDERRVRRLGSDERAVRRDGGRRAGELAPRGERLPLQLDQAALLAGLDPPGEGGEEDGDDHVAREAGVAVRDPAREERVGHGPGELGHLEQLSLLQLLVRGDGLLSPAGE